MSDGWIVVIPKDPNLAPDAAALERLKRALARIAPKAELVEIVPDSGVVRFFDCGENFSGVCCPGCGEELDTGEWSDWMRADFGSGPGFSLAPRAMRCCGEATTLADLDYDMPQGFARAGVRAMNCDRGPLDAGESAELEAALVAPVRLVYSYI